MPIDWKATMDDTAVTRAFRNIETGASKTVRSVESTFGVLTAGALGAGILAIGKSVVDLAGDIADSAEAVGLTSNAYQELTGVFEQGGVKAEKFTKAMGVLQQSIQEAVDGNEKTRTSFERLGITWEELNTASPEEILNDIAEGLQNSSNWTESFAAATDILGKGQTKLIGQLRAGKEALDEQRKSIITMSETAVQAFDAAGDAAQRMGKGALSIFGNALAGAQAFFETLYEDAMGVPADFESRIANNRANKPKPAPAPIPEDPRIKKLREEDAKNEADMMKEYNRLEEEAAQRAAKNQAAQEQALARRAEMQRAFYIDGLEGEDKLKALEEDRLKLEDKMFVAGDAEKAQIMEKISLVEQQIAQEKRLEKERERASRIRRLQEDLSENKAKLSGLQDKSLDFGLMTSDERRNTVRAQRREARERARQDRIERSGNRDARFGAGAIQKEISLTKDTIRALANELDKLVLK